MNAMWNTVNLTLGIVGFVSNRKPPVFADAGEAWDAYRKVRTVYLVNNLLDVLYISGGIGVQELGRQRGWDRVRGYGTSVILQGAFLFAFDLSMLIAHERVAARAGVVRPSWLACSGKPG